MRKNISKQYAKWLAETSLHGGKNASATKAGPGRYHEQGHQKWLAPVKRTAPIGSAATFSAPHTNPARKAKKQLRLIASARQVRMQIKATRREQGARP